jgi:uncharacterized protein (TIGR00304 family)
LGDPTLVEIGVLLMLAGFLLAFVALAVPLLRGGSSSQAGAVVIIGPLPLVFGSSRRMARLMLVVAAVLFAFFVGFFILQSFFS